MKNTLRSGTIKILTLLTLMCSSALWAQNVPDLAWARTISNSGFSTAENIVLDEAGNSYVSGSFNTSLTINGTTITHLNPGGGASRFLIKYDPSGNGIWIKKIPFTINKLLVKGNNLYLAATYLQDVQHFDGIPFPTPSTAQGAYCLIQIRLDGTTQWIRPADYNGMSTGSPSFTVSVFADQDEHVHMAGIFQGSVTFHNGVTLVNTESASGADAFRAVYDVSGNLLSATKLGVVNPDLSANENEYFDMDAENNFYRYVAIARKLMKYNEQGTVAMEKQLTITGTGIVDLSDMSVDPAGNVFLAGYMYGGSFTFDGTAITKFGDANKTDAIILKLRASDGAVEWIDHNKYVHCDYFTHILTDGLGNVYATGIKSLCIGGDVNLMYIKYNNAGDRIQEMDITPGPPPSPDAPAGWVSGECLAQAHNGGNILIAGYFRERVKFDASVSFTAPGDYRAFVVQYGVCDTPQPVISSDGAFCEGDSLMISVPDVSGNSYVWSNGDTTAVIYVHVPGVYSVMVAENEECYAVSETVEVTEIPLPPVTVTQNGGTLTAISGYNYQWLRCGNATNFPVSGATSASFTPEEDGSYAVIVTNDQGCADTSTCYDVFNVGLEQQEMNKLIIYPNPANTFVLISNIPANSSISVLDMTGRILYRNTQAKEEETISVLNYPNGIYLLQIENSGEVETGKIVVRN